MVIGIGHDIVRVARIETMLRRYGERFTRRVFTEGERAHCDHRYLRTACYAKRFAAKEACVKAFGTGISTIISWLDMHVTHDRRGKPTIILSTRAMARAMAYLTTRPMSHMPQGEGQKIVLHLTISDIDSLASAFVLIEAIEHGDVETHGRPMTSDDI